MAEKAVRSMTGFAQVRRTTGVGELTLSLRSVNHRGLDLHFHHSAEFAMFENAMRALLKENIGRGHVEIRGGLKREERPASGLNVHALRQFAGMFEAAAADLRLDCKPDLNRLLSLPGVVSERIETQDLDGGFEAELLDALSECIALFNQSRQREGVKLAEEMLKEVAEVESATEQIRGLRAEIQPFLQQRLRDRLTELLSGGSLSEARIVEEAALLADRSDVQEELTRLTVHSGELRRMLSGGGALGKQIDFLVQELNRETNTTLAKSSNAGDPGLQITSLALATKANIERIREQALNLE